MSSAAGADRDGRARARIVGELDRSALVEAAAGTGKTTILVSRLVEVLATERASIERIVAVTFTRKAAGELKLRLRQALDRARSEARDGRRRACLTDALARLEEASVGTIHSFCAEILRQRPVEAGIDPEFGEIDQEEADALFRQAFRRWIERTLTDPPAGVARALRRLAAGRSYDGSSPLDRLRAAAGKLRDWRDYPAPWARRPFAREAAIERLVGSVRELAALYEGNPDARDPLRQAIAPAWRLAEWLRRSEAVSERDIDALEAQLLELAGELRKEIKRKGRGPWPVEGISRADVAARRDALIAQLDAFRTAADADLAALLREELQGVLAEYERLKRQAGQLDFLDLLLRARDLIRDHEGVRRHLQSSISHLFVDEFQDTDPLQVEILLLLAASDPGDNDWRRVKPLPGKLFLVGDPKQSIYRFRRADVLLYEEVKQQLVAAGVDLHVLSRSWRSVRPLQATVNAAFAPEMVLDRRVGQPAYVPLEEHRPAIAEQPAVVALPIPRPYTSWGRITGRRLEEQQPDLIAAFLEWLLRDSGWVVRDPDEDRSPVPVQARHVALLFRRFLSWGRDVTRPYLAALETRGIPHLLAGGRSFHQREEVETLRAAATAIEWPEDELSLYATLKGSLFAISDAALLRYREEVGRLHPLRPHGPLDQELEPVGAALELLARLHRRRNRVPATEILRRLLEETRAHAGFAMRPAGHQVLANVQRVLDLARAFELRGGLSFRGFVQRLTEEAERAGSAETPLVEEDAEGVRLLTVHTAKGLEFPVVVLADVTASLARSEPTATIDPKRRLCAMRLLGCAPWELVEQADLERERDRAEGVRLAYVAATRARDLLVVPTVGDGPWEGGWVSPLNRALYPPREQHRRARPAPGCPAFGDRTVLERPHRAAGEAEPSVRPGLHLSEAGEPVVWWDPALLRLGVEPNFGLRQEELLQPPQGDELPGARLWASWQERHQAALRRGAEPTRRVLLASQLREPPARFERAIEVLATKEPAAASVGGTRFGTLVHAILRDATGGADGAQIAALARQHGRTLGAVPEEVAAAARRVGAAFAHPLLLEAAAAPVSHREVPFLLAGPDGCLIDGVIDLVFGDGAAWTVVDFKTDAGAEPTALIERYRAQALWYAWAVEQLLGGRTRVVLMAV